MPLLKRLLRGRRNHNLHVETNLPMKGIAGRANLPARQNSIGSIFFPCISKMARSVHRFFDSLISPVCNDFEVLQHHNHLSRVGPIAATSALPSSCQEPPLRHIMIYLYNCFRNMTSDMIFIHGRIKTTSTSPPLLLAQHRSNRRY